MWMQSRDASRPAPDGTVVMVNDGYRWDSQPDHSNDIPCCAHAERVRSSGLQARAGGSRRPHSRGNSMLAPRVGAAAPSFAAVVVLAVIRLPGPNQPMEQHTVSEGTDTHRDTETHQPNRVRTTNIPRAATSSPALMWAEPRSSLMNTVPAGGMVPSSLLARHSSDALMKVDIACWCKSAKDHSPVSCSLYQ